MTLMERFETRYEPEPTSGCWLWTGRRDSFGYGVVPLGTRGRRQLAHRAAWELFRGVIQGGLQVCHRCDIPSCVNPNHLFLGTQGDNVRDCHAKNRNVKNTWTAGASNPHARLTWADVRDIRLVDAGAAG
mgnify:CR=1 FL=1